MNQLREVKNKREHYFEDENEVVQGPYLSWHENGVPRLHCTMLDGMKVGEFKVWHENGNLKSHLFFSSSGELFLKNEIRAVVADISNITDEEKSLIKLKWGIRCLD